MESLWYNPLKKSLTAESIVGLEGENMGDLLDPKIDFVFKRIFGSEENKDVLLAFLNDTFKAANNPPLTQITLMNPYVDPNAVGDKQSILDIRAVAADGEQINIEIQLLDQRDIQKRTLYYWAKLYEEQLEEGQLYKDLKKTITINIINFKALPNDRYHNIFHLRENHSDLILTEDIEIHFMELPKLQDEAYSLEDRLVRWLLFLKGIQQTKWEELAMGTPELKKAMTTLEFLSQDKEARYLYEMRKKALLDERSRIDWAKEQGIKEGIEKGLERGIKQVAKNMLDEGLDLSTIAKATGLTVEELQKLKEQTH